MELVADVVAWFLEPDHWQGSDGVPARTLEHLWYSVVAVLAATALALPVGLWVGHTGRGGAVAVNVANLGRAIPSLGILTLMVVAIGIGFWPAFIALMAFGIPPILTNAYTGVREVDDDVREAARGMGMRGGELLRRVEIPIALPLVMAGIRTSAVQVVATATLAAVVGLDGFGRYIVNGLAVQDFAQVAAGAILVAVLAILVEVGLAALQRALVPEGIAAVAEQAATDAKVQGGGVEPGASAPEARSG